MPDIPELAEMNPRDTCRYLGIRHAELGGLRSGNKYQRLQDSVDVVYADDRRRLALATYGLLEFMTGINKSEIYKMLKKEYEDRKRDIKELHNLDPPYIELFRHDVSSESLPLIKERKYWKSFKPSADDWRWDVTLPTPPLTAAKSQAVGIMWGDGYFKYGGNGVRLHGTKGDMDFYEMLVAPTLSKMFNKPVHMTELNRKAEICGKAYEYTNPIIDLGSKAVAIWLKNDIGFHKGAGGRWKKRVRLPLECCNAENFFEGLVASMGSLYVPKKINQRPFLSIADKDRLFLSEVRELAKSLGYKPRKLSRVGNNNSLGTNSWNFSFSVGDTKNLTLINPRHSS